MKNNSGMTATERRTAISLASVFSTRMLGLFMILPVFALYAEELGGSTPLMVGLAIGIYGLTQAILQIPFGMLSDRIGRKPVIYLGLTIFAIGSVIAAMADSMVGVIIGRAIQGAGAIAAVMTALAADLTREEHRLRAMAIIGISMGLSFTVSLILGPLMNAWIGVDGIFWFTAVLAVGGMFILKFVVPNPVSSRFHRDAAPVPEQFKTILSDHQLLRLDYGIFALHLILTAIFVAVPHTLRDGAGLEVNDHWLVYLGVMLVSFVAMVPFIIIAEKKRRMKQVFVAAITLLMISLLTMALSGGALWVMVIALLLFFTAFNVLEASLPSLVAKMSPADKKGTAMGVYSSSQFMGAFVGGVVGGVVFGQFGPSGVFALAGIVAASWVLVAATMKNPRYLSSHMINVGDVTEEEARHLVTQMTQCKGVAEAVIIAEDGVAYLKVDSHAVDLEDLNSRFSILRDDESSEVSAEPAASRS